MSAVKNIQHRLEYLAFLIIAAAARALPVETASRWSAACWRLIAPRLRRHRRAVRNLTAAFPEKSPVEIQRIALAMWDNLGRNFAEFFHLDQIIASDRIQFESTDLFESWRARGGGVVICGLHMANWEILSQGPIRAGWRPAGVYQTIANPFVDRYVCTKRAALYPGGLMEKSAKTARTLLRRAREGGCAALLADQREAKGIPALFFGRPASSTIFPALIARSVDAPIYLFSARRLDHVRFSIRAEEITVPRTADRDADVAVATRSVQAALERIIREAPEQWMWAHRRWD